MKFKVMTIGAIFAALLVSGCATQQGASRMATPPEVASLTHEFWADKDNLSERGGANQTYVVIEKRPNSQYKVVAISDRFIPLTRTNQEELFFSKNFTNVTPAWQSYHLGYTEDPKTGIRSKFTFKPPFSNDPIFNYSPNHESPFTVEADRGVIVIVGKPEPKGNLVLANLDLNVAIAESNALNEAKAWAAGSRTYPNAAPQIQQFTFDDVVLRIRLRNGGDVSERYFVPNSVMVRSNGIAKLDIGSTLSYDTSVGRLPFENVSRANLYGLRAPDYNNSMGCSFGYFDYQGEKNKEGRICAWASERDGGWDALLHANSPTLGHVRVVRFEGKTYDLKGNDMFASGLNMSPLVIDKIELLDKEARVKIRATFKK